MEGSRSGEAGGGSGLEGFGQKQETKCKRIRKERGKVLGGWGPILQGNCCNLAFISTDRCNRMWSKRE